MNPVLLSKPFGTFWRKETTVKSGSLRDRYLEEVKDLYSVEKQTAEVTNVLDRRAAREQEIAELAGTTTRVEAQSGNQR